MSFLRVNFSGGLFCSKNNRTNFDTESPLHHPNPVLHQCNPLLHQCKRPLERPSHPLLTTFGNFPFVGPAPKMLGHNLSGLNSCKCKTLCRRIKNPWKREAIRTQKKNPQTDIVTKQGKPTKQGLGVGEEPHKNGRHQTSFSRMTAKPS